MKATDERNKYLAFALIVVFVVSGLGVISFYSGETSGSHSTTAISSNTTTSTKTTISSSSSNSASSYWSNQPYMNASKVYASLGYPKVTYNNFDTPYHPSDSNFTLYYHTKDTGFPVGTVETPVVSLNEAVNLAAAYAKLDPVNYTLGAAEFGPGTIFNATMIAYPEWFIFFAQVHDGYWIYGNLGPHALSVEVVVDALNGTVRHKEAYTLDLTNSGQYPLTVNSSRALEIVRASNLTGVPRALAENGTVGFMEPRVVIPGQFPGSQWIDSFLSGRSQLLWIIELDDSNFGGTFAVDAGTGILVTGTAGRFFENPLGGSYYGSVAFSTAKNMAVSKETFQTNGSIIGKSGSVGVVVPDVLIAKPGSTSSIQLNYTTFNSHNPPNVTLSVVNPLPGYQNSFSSDGSPPGVSFQFLRPTLSLVSNSSAYATLSISVDRNAPSGTYLIEVDATYPSADLEGRIQLFFFLSIWDGLGQWLPPPMVK